MATKKHKGRDAATQERHYKHLCESAFICGSKYLFLCLLVFFVAIPAFSAPRIACDTPKYDFGTMIGQEKITHEFVLFNKGDEPLEIVKIKNCCGVESKVVPKMILPGSNAVCTAVFTIRNRYGSQDKQILLITNDKKHPYFDLRLTGTLLKPIEFSPRWIRLGDLTPGSAILQSISATNLLEQAVRLDSVESTIQGIGAEIVGEVGDPARSWNIEVHTVGSLPVGKINGQIQLNFSSGTVKVPMIGNVKPVIQAVPNSIQFSSTLTERVERLVMLRGESPFEVDEVFLENVSGNTVAEQISIDTWRIKVLINPASLQSGAALVVRTSCKQHAELRIVLSKSGV